MPRLLVIMPALNEEGAVGDVVASTKRSLDADVVVVDDGSTDETSRVARDFGATVIRHPFNLGVGAAIRTGLRYAADLGYEQVVLLDADGQHDPKEASILLACLEEGNLDIVVGGRFSKGYKVSVPRRLAMRLLSSIVSRRVGTRIEDTSSGFRALGPRALRYFAVAYPVDYLSDTVEALALAGDAGLRAGEVAVHMRLRQVGEPSTGPLTGTFHLTRLLLALALHRVRKPLQDVGST